MKTNVGIWEYDPNAYRPGENLNKSIPIAKYKLISNVEIVPTSLDIATGTFTKVNHGLVTNDRLFATMNWSAGALFPLAIMPGGLTLDKVYAKVLTPDTFQVTLSPGDAQIIFTSLGDFTKWHFEKNPPLQVGITGLAPKKKYKTTFRGKTCGSFYVRPSDDFWYDTSWIVLSTGYGYPGIDGSNRPNIAADIDCIFDIDTFTSIRFAGTTIRNNTNIAFTRNNINTTFMKFGTAPDITNLGVYSNYGVMNGSIFEVYDV